MVHTEAEQARRPPQPKIQDIILLKEQLRRLNVVYIDGNISDEEYTTKCKHLKVEIEKARQQSTEQPIYNLSTIKDFLDSDFLATYETLSKEDKRRFWRTLIEEIYIEGTTVTGIKPRL